MGGSDTPAPMKIGFIAQDSLSTINFATFYAHELASRPGVTFCMISSLEALYRGEIEALPARHIAVDGKRFIDPVRDIRYLADLWRVIRRERFDVVVTFGTKPNLYGALAARLAGARRIIVAVRGLGRVFGKQQSPQSHLLRAVVHGLYRIAFWSATRVWFTNPNDREYFVANGLLREDKTFLTNNSVNLEKFSPAQIPAPVRAALRRELNIEPNDFVVIMVARLIWQKGVREFAEAARQLRRTHPGMRFLLVAPPEDASDLAVPESYVRDLEREGVLTWLGFRKDVLELYALADVAVLPSYYREGGYPRALLEPMALGKPVIAANTEDCRGPVRHGENGFLVPPRDGAALAARIEELFCDPGLRSRLGVRSLEIMRQEFDDRIVGRQVLAEIGLDP